MSDQQKALLRTAELLRLAINVKLTSEKLTAECIEHLADAAQTAFWLHKNAMCFDKMVELEQNRLYCDSE